MWLLADSKIANLKMRGRDGVLFFAGKRAQGEFSIERDKGDGGILDFGVNGGPRGRCRQDNICDGLLDTARGREMEAQGYGRFGAGPRR